jgi:type IV pilus assembly protein PilB
MRLLKEEITEILLKKTHVTRGQMEHALGIHKSQGVPLRKVLVDEGLASDELLSSLFSERVYIPGMNLDGFNFDGELVKLFPENMARLYNSIPLLKDGDKLVIATSDPLNAIFSDELGVFCRCAVSFVLSNEEEITRAIDEQYYGRTDSARVKSGLPDAVRHEQVPVSELVDIVIAHALSKKASDIHIEPESDSLRVRYRVDGLLQDIIRVPKVNQETVFARVKLISNMNITDKHIPQEGKLKVKAGGEESEFRVSALPTAFGMKFVLHVLNGGDPASGKDFAETSAIAADIFKEVCGRKSGLVLVSGPASSGRSATLYSLLAKLNSPQRSIFTIEDPVESRIDGINQLQVNLDTGLDFEGGLRSVMRQKPDAVMLSHIRDARTAEAAVKAALSGCLIFSAVQAGDTASAIWRLIEMGVEPFLAASGLAMVSSQRLARRNCPKCRRQSDIPKLLLDDKLVNANSRVYSAPGCKHCNYTGFSGRVAIWESILIDQAIRDIIVCRRPMAEIRKYAAKHLGLKTLKDNACAKVKEGLISPDEALRVISEE